MIPSSKPFRAFLSLPVPLAQGALFAQVRSQFAGAAIVWTPPEKLHLTLAFLGNIEATTAQHIGTLLQAPGCQQAIPLRCTAVAPFPAQGSAILAALVEPAPALLALHQQVTEGLEASAIPYDNKPFKPHITLGRCKQGIHAPALNLNIAITANPLELWRSEQTAQGSLYTRVT